jgi:arylsulfatase A-like enzyme
MKRLLSPLIFLLCVFAASAAPTEKPNIVVFLADDLGINDLGCYGRAEHRTPNLDRLSDEGKRFTCAYAPAAVCSPTRAALMTGQHPARLQITSFLPGRPDWPGHRLLQPALPAGLNADAETIAEKLKKVGYVTGCVGKWHLGARPPMDPSSRGFDYVFAGKPNTQPSEVEGGKGEFGQAAKAIEFLQKNAANPFFLYMALDNPHVPLNAHPERVAANANAFNPVYAAMIETLDVAVGRVLEQIDSLGLREKTMVVFCSDNGGLHVLELPATATTPATHNTPFRAGKGFLYEGGLREPLLVRWPGKIAPGLVQDPVVLADLVPTFLEIAGAAPSEPSDYRSIGPVLFGRGALDARPLFWHMPNYTNQGGLPSGAVREGDWKLIEHYEDGRLELFNVESDPSEQRDVAASDPAKVAAMRGKLEAWRRSVSASMPQGNPSYQPRLWDACYGGLDASVVERRSTALEMSRSMSAWREAMDGASPKRLASLVDASAPAGLVMLEAKHARVVGEKLRYEDLPQKDTLGFWVNPADYAEWSCVVPQAGRYAVEVLQGCVKGGSTVDVRVGEQSARFTVEDTGHFQRFVPRRVGVLELPAGSTTVSVRPHEKKGGAVMDLRRVMLVRVE